MTWAIQERAVHPNLNAGPGGMGIKFEQAYTIEARHHVQAVALSQSLTGAPTVYPFNPAPANGITFGSVCSGIEAASVAGEPLGWRAAWFSEIEPFPAAVLAHHFHEVQNLGDMTTILERVAGGLELVAPDVLCGGTPCFTEDALVWTGRGHISIKDVVVGDVVLTHTGRWRKVLRVGSKMASTITVKGQGHHGIVTTTEHPFLTIPTKRVWNNARRSTDRVFGDPAWVNAGDLKGKAWTTLTDVAPLPVPPVLLLEGERAQVDITCEKFWWMVGAWLGNGWVRDTPRPEHGGEFGTVVICDGYADADALAEHLEGCGIEFAPSREKTGVKFRGHSKALVRWLTSNFGRYSGGKYIPAWALGMPLPHRKSLLEGYLFTDGSIHKDRRSGAPNGAQWSSISKPLIYGICQLMATVGRATSITKVDVSKPGRRASVIEGRAVNEQDSYIARSFDTPRSSFQHAGYRAGVVRSVLPSGNAAVYNLEVDEDNSYTADNLVVHNCQAFSVAGNRKSLDDARGNLTLVFCNLADGLDEGRAALGLPATVIFYENVPGILNTKDNAFGCFLGRLAGEDDALVAPGGKWPNAGYVLGPKRKIAWRVLDAQHFGVAQRRRRVFVIASAREGFDPREVLLECESMRGDPAASGGPREGIATDVEGGPGIGGRVATFQQSSMKGKGTIGYDESGVAKPVKTQMDGQMVCISKADTLIPEGDCVTFQPGNLMRRAGADPSPNTTTLKSSPGDQTPCVAVKDHKPMRVRRLTPTECERLQGFPDDWTAIPWKNKPADACPDGPRYKALGNSWAVPCVQWIFRRLNAVLTGQHAPATGPMLGAGEMARDDLAFEVGPATARFTDIAPTMDCRAKNGPIQNQLGVGVLVRP